MENKGGNARNVELRNLNNGKMVDARNSLARDEPFRFSISTISSVESYEARFGSERLERFRQCWEIEKGRCNEVTKGP